MHLWDSASLWPLALLSGHTDSVIGAAPAPVHRILSWSRDKSIRLWEEDSAQVAGAFEEIVRLERHDGTPAGAAFTPSGQLVSWDEDFSFHLWDLDTRRCLNDLSANEVYLEAPEWVRLAYETAQWGGDLLGPNALGWSRGRTAGVTILPGSLGRYAVWHSDCDLQAHHLLPNSILSRDASRWSGLFSEATIMNGTRP
jgi:WD40 repeat protein